MSQVLYSMAKLNVRAERYTLNIATRCHRLLEGATPRNLALLLWGMAALDAHTLAIDDHLIPDLLEVGAAG